MNVEAQGEGISGLPVWRRRRAGLRRMAAPSDFSASLRSWTRPNLARVAVVRGSSKRAVVQRPRLTPHAGRTATIWPATTRSDADVRSDAAGGNVVDHQRRNGRRSGGRPRAPKGPRPRTAPAIDDDALQADGKFEGKAAGGAERIGAGGGPASMMTDRARFRAAVAEIRARWSSPAARRRHKASDWRRRPGAVTPMPLNRASDRRRGAACATPG